MAGAFIFINLTYDPVLAIVGNKVLRLKEWEFIQSKAYGDSNVDQSISKNRLETWGLEELVLRKAREWNITVDEAKIKEFSQKNTDKNLSVQKITRAESEELIRRNYFGVKMKNIITSNVSVSSEEVEDYFKKFQSQFDLPETRTARIIKISSNDTELIEKITKEISIENFASYVKNFSEDPQRELGGLTNQESFEGLEAEMGSLLTQQIFKSNLEQVSGPIQNSNWTYWIKVEDINPSRKAKLQDVSEKIKKIILQIKQQKKMAAWLNEQKSDTHFEIRDSNLRRSRFLAFLGDLVR